MNIRRSRQGRDFRRSKASKAPQFERRSAAEVSAPTPKLLARVQLALEIYLGPVKTTFGLAYRLLNAVPMEVWALFVLAFGIGLRLLFPNMLAIWDDIDYATIAKTIEEGRYSIGNYSNWFGHRFPVLYPVAWSMKVFGYEEWVLMIWPFTASVLNMVFIYFVGRILFNAKAGFFALLLLAIHPIDAKHATLLLPASIYTMLLLGGMLFFLVGERYRPKIPLAPFRFGLPQFKTKAMQRVDRFTRPGWRRATIGYVIWLAAWILAGYLWANTYYIRAYGALILGVPAIYMLLRYRIRWEYIWMPALAIGCWLIIEMVLYKITGEWMFIYKFLKSRVGPDLYKHQNVAEHLDKYRNIMFNEKIYNAFTFVLMLCLPIYLWGYRKLTPGKRAAHWVPLGFIVLFFGYMEFGVTSLEHMSMLRKMERYIGIITPGVCLIIARVISTRLPKLTAPVIIILLALVTWWWLGDAGLPPWLTKGSVY